MTTTPPASEIQVAEGEQPHVRFTWTPAEPHAGEEVRFIPQARAHAGAKALSWHWSFGDDAWSRDAQPLHVYADDGVHEVRVTLELDDHSRLQHTEEIEILKAAPDRAPEPDAEPGPEDPAPESSPDDGGAKENDTRPRKPYVVVATFDTGVNPYHPAWRIEGDPTAYLPGFPEDTVRVELTLGQSPAADRKTSAEEWKKVLDHDGRPVVFNGTRIVAARAAASDLVPFYDAAGNEHYHGARASSQIAGTGYAVGDNAYVVPLDFVGGASGDRYESFIREQMDWVLQQPWIDIIHVNMAFPAPFPVPNTMMQSFSRAADEGRLVVLAGGNGLGNGGPPYPMETQHTTGAPGTLVAGANDQCAAGAYWSNLNPHVVMDGSGTVAAHETSYGDAPFSGTSSASPRVSGYAAELLYQARVHFNHTDGLADGALLVIPNGTERPVRGPLVDGMMDAHEFHEVIRKTAIWPHESSLDGSSYLGGCPGIPDAGVPLYAKYGYGEVSEKTLPHALEVILGSRSLPERPQEDLWFGLSEGVRETLHG